MIPAGGMGRRQMFLLPASLCLLLLTFLVANPGQAGNLPASGNGRLFLVSWEVSVLGRIETGTACWIEGPDGVFRLEVLPGVAGREALPRLLRRQGDGYTLILGGGAEGVFNAWQHEWKKLGENMVPWVRFVTLTLLGKDGEQGSGSGRGRRLVGNRTPVGTRPFFRDDPFPDREAGGRRIELPALAVNRVAAGTGTRNGGRPAGTPFRSGMVQRGGGRGGNREILTMTRDGSIPGFAWLLLSSRKPGRILLSNPEIIHLGPVGLEVFPPLWPLSELVEIDH